MKNPISFFACLPLVFLPAAQAAGTLTLSVVDSGNLGSKNYDLGSMGSLDWKLFASASTTASEAKSGGSGLSALSYSDPNMGTGLRSESSSSAPAYTWTGGSPTPTGSNTDLNFSATPYGTTTTTGEVFSISADATTSLRTLYLIVGANRAGGTLVASLSDGSATAVMNTYDTGAGSFGFRTYRIDFSADMASGETLDVTWTKTDDNNQVNSHIRFQAAALTVPEPSAGLLCFAGLGLAIFSRRR